MRTNKAFRTDSYLALDHRNTIATWLSDAGMRTAHVGKYLNGYGYRSLDPAVPDNREIPPGWSDFHTLVGGIRFTDFTMNSNGRLVNFSGWDDYQTDVLARRGAEFIASSARAGDPFFLWVTPLAPHTAGGQPPAPAPRHRSAFDGVALPRPANFDEADTSDKPGYVARQPRLTPERIAQMRAHHEARLESLLAVDDLVEALVDQLSAVGELDQTLVIFTSDHGYMLGNHRLEGKVRPYEESIRIPLVLRGGPFTGGRSVDHLVSNLDVTPTIMELLGHPARRTMDGLELTSILVDPGRYDGRALIVESVEGPGYDAVRTENWMWIEYQGSSRELYDLAADPAQLQSLHGAGGRAAEARSQLASLLRRLRTCQGQGCVVQFDPGRGPTTTSPTTTSPTTTSPTTTSPSTTSPTTTSSIPSGGGTDGEVTAPGTPTTPAVRAMPGDRRVDVSWEHPDAQRFQLRYRRTGTRKWSWQSSTAATTAQLTGLAAQTAYDIEVRAYIGRSWRTWASVQVSTS